MNPLEILMKEMNKSGISCEITRKNQDGILEKVKENELKTLSTKSQIATTAHLLSRLTKQEKLVWALETKDEGNELYQQQNYLGAMEKYVECLTATDFGTKKDENTAEKEDTVQPNPEESSDNNVDELVIPVLCNLAACCLQLKQWSKAILFCQQALQVRPNAIKALYRQGVAYVHCGDYQLAIKNFQQIVQSFKDEKSKESSSDDDEETEPKIPFQGRKAAAETSQQEEEDSDIKYTHRRNVNRLTAKERKNLLLYITKAKQGIHKDKEDTARQKQALQKAFQSAPSSHSNATVSETSKKMSETTEQPYGIKRWLLHLLNSILKFILQLLLRFLRIVLAILKLFVKTKPETKE